MYATRLTILLLSLLLPLAPATEAAKCNFTASSINFGTYSLTQPSPNTTTGTISITCNPNPPQIVTVSLSTGSSGTYTQREMTPSLGWPDRLLYNIFTDPSGTAVFGNGTGGSQVLSNSVSKTQPWNITYYGRIPPGQDIPADLYLDMLTLTVDF